MNPCRTPGARYHIRIEPNAVECKVDIPFNLDLSEEAAAHLEKRMHDAIQDTLALYWRPSNPWEGFDKIPPGF